MKFIVEFREIEAMILAKTGLQLSLRESGKELIIQPRNMGLIQDRVKVRIKIDNTYKVPNRLKIHVSAGVLSSIVVPKIMSMLDFMPEGSVARQKDGTVFVLLDKIPQLKTFCKNFRIDRIDFENTSERIIIIVSYSEESGINVDDIPPRLEDSWKETTSLKDREIGNTFVGIARSIFESDKIDEGVQALKEKAKELKDAHGEELKDAAISWLKKKLRSTDNRSSNASE